MKTILFTAIAIMVIMIGCDIENNANKSVLDYTTTILLLPCLTLAIYAVTHLNEFKNFIK